MARRKSWEILKKDEAELLRIKILHADEDGFLCINVEDIPNGLSIEDFIDNIIDKGIVIQR